MAFGRVRKFVSSRITTFSKRMMKTPPAYQRYPKQILGDDVYLAMDTTAVGAHNLLLDISWQQDPPGTIPSDAILLRRWSRLASPSDDETWRRVWPQVRLAWIDLGNGRLGNKGMMATFARQSRYSESRSKNAKGKHMQSICKTYVEHSSSIAYEDEDRRAVEVGFALDPPPPENSFAELCTFHPRPNTGQAAESAFIDAVEWIVKTRKCTRAQAADYLKQRATLYRSKTDKWAGADRPMVKGLTNWLRDHTFDEDESFWERGDNRPCDAHMRGEDWTPEEIAEARKRIAMKGKS